MSERTNRHSFKRHLGEGQEEVCVNKFGQTVTNQNENTTELPADFVIADGQDAAKGFVVKPASILNVADSVLNTWLEKLPEDGQANLLNQLQQFQTADVNTDVDENTEVEFIPTIHDVCMQKIDDLDEEIPTNNLVKQSINVSTELRSGVINQKTFVEKSVLSENSEEKSCKKCTSIIPQNAKFCPECGSTQISKFCIECGYAYKGKENFCPECGAHR